MSTISEINQVFKRDRDQLISNRVAASRLGRSELVELTDRWVQALAKAADLESVEVALIAVGGYGRGDLCASSDLDLLLLHPNDVSVQTITKLADSLWYPIWDSGIPLDHSVRSVSQARLMASTDIKVLLGLLDARTIAGNDELTQQLRSSALADWRVSAKNRLPELWESVQTRRQRAGDLSHLLEPDLKESYGGLREFTVIRAIAASWITDIDHLGLETASEFLLDVRDNLHQVTNRRVDRLSMQEQSSVASIMNFENDDELLRAVFSAGRTISVASDLAWHRFNQITAKKSIFRKITSSKVDRVPLADGVVVHNDEVVLAREVDITKDPVVVLRAAAAAAQAGLRLSPHTVSRFAQEFTEIPTPWSRDAKDALVSFLGAGTSAIPVWEALDQQGVITKLLPEWEAIRAAPQRNALHIFTVDRHSLECAVQAASLTRKVDRPDLLLVGALFHDIGKARGSDHCGKGEALMRTIAPQLGFDEADTDILCVMVKHHLLLPESATRRDLEDPATIRTVVDCVGSHEVLDLLHYLSIADSKATSDSMWSEWKQRLLEDLVRRTHAALAGETSPQMPRLNERFPIAPEEGKTDVIVSPSDNSVTIFVSTPDRLGLLSTVAAALALLRLDVRAAYLETQGEIALQEWHAVTTFGEIPDSSFIRTEILRALKSPQEIDNRVTSLMVGKPPRRGFTPPDPVVRALPQASSRTSVIEVRAHDAPALLYRVGKALVAAKATVTTARVMTLGSEVVDVLYLYDSQGNPLSEAVLNRVVDTVTEAVRPVGVVP